MGAINNALNEFFEFPNVIQLINRLHFLLKFYLFWTGRFGFGAVIPTFRFLSCIMQSQQMKYCLKLISCPLIKSFL